MKAVFRKSDGSYVDNEQSWAAGQKDLAEAAARKHGGRAADYRVMEAERPWLKKVAGGKLVDDAERQAELATLETARRAEAEAESRIERRRLEADLGLAQKAGDVKAVELLQARLRG